MERFEINKDNIINWIYSLQVQTTRKGQGRNDGNAGFKGGTFLGTVNRPMMESWDTSCDDPCSDSSSSFDELKYDQGHVAMNYTALCTLITLGDDLKRVDRRGIIQSLKQLQLPDGR